MDKQLLMDKKRDLLERIFILSVKKVVVARHVRVKRLMLLLEGIEKVLSSLSS